ncbi:hypothetical protein [Algoriphagus aquimarinus]|uniref:hypothetical protein n=1 Tax=Algoriphagus aquimarinus TaxID=237018 RepID=UPI0030DD27BD
MKSRGSKNSVNDFKLIEEFEGIGALFNQGSIVSLSRLQEHQPTNLSKALQMGFNTYTDKLRNPERFSLEDIIKLAIVIGTDYRKILEVIQKEIKEKFKV